MNRSIPLIFLSALQIWNPTMRHSSSSSIDTFCMASGGVMAIHERRASAVGEFGLVGSESSWFSTWIFHPLSPKSCGDFAILPDREMPFQRLRFECERLTCQRCHGRLIRWEWWDGVCRGGGGEMKLMNTFWNKWKMYVHHCPQVVLWPYLVLDAFMISRHHLREHHPGKSAKALQKSHGFNCSC